MSVNEKKSIWLWEFNRKMDLLRIYSFAKSYAKYNIKFFYYNNNGCTDFYWDKRVADNIAGAILKKSINSDYLDYEFRKIKTIINAFDQLIKRFKKQDFFAMSNKKLYENYLLYHNMVYQGGLCAVFIRIFIYTAEPFLRSEFEKKYKKKANEIFLILTKSNKRSFTQKEEVGLFEIALKLISNKKSIKSELARQLVNKHLIKYAYIPCGYFDEKPYSFNDLEKRLKKLLSLNANQIIEKISLYNKKSQLLKNKYLRQNSELKKIIQGVERSIYFKEVVRGKINELSYYSYPLFEQIAEKTNLSLRDFKMLMPDEFRKVLLENKDCGKLIRERSRFILLGNSKKMVIYNKKKADKLIKMLLRDEVLCPSDGLKGNCANTGVVKGIVRVVKNFSEKINSGDVLVTRMTTPEYVPLMRKAIAFITDEGGVTCHAAIVARELKKPCIIGTKIATKVLRDGDLVEVDADKGVVKILKRADGAAILT